MRTLLTAGAPVDGGPEEVNSPLFLACRGRDPERRVETARLLLDAGAFPRAICEGGSTPLHQAARNGPAELVELLLRRGALFWQGDAQGRRPVDDARDGTPIDRDRILWLCADGPKISDPIFRAAVAAIQSGDVEALTVLLDAHPRLLTERAIEPDIGPRGYFSDPKLFWFIANNPTLIPTSPPNIVEVAGLMLGRGIAAGDLDYALELVMTNGMMPGAGQIALASVLVEAGATATTLAALGHRQTAVLKWLTARGRPLDVETAAGLGEIEALRRLLPAAGPKARSTALDLAVINSQSEAVSLCLKAGVDPNHFMAIHSHSTPLHQAALHGDLEILGLLVAAGARTDAIDTLWRGMPLGWALHGEQAAAADWLRSRA